MHGSAKHAARSLAAVATLACAAPAAAAEGAREARPLEVRRFGARGTGSGWLQPQLPMAWNDAEVEHFVGLFSETRGGRQRFAQGLKRLQQHAASLGGILAANGVPRDLLYVALVESGFEPRARSPKAALGIWQLGAATAAEYGLRKDVWLDERRDPWRATAAAARYLADLQTRFGCWKLALAAYNAGPGRVVQAMRRANSNDYEVLCEAAVLPRETRTYVAKVMASAWVGNNAQHYRLTSAEASPRRGFAFDIVHVPAGTTLRAMAHAAQTTVAELMALNPALNRQAVPHTSSAYAMRVPADRGMEVLRSLVPPPSSTSHGKRRLRREDAASKAASWQPYRIRFGESLSSVASRFASSEAALRRGNALAADAALSPGGVLWVPSKVEASAPTDWQRQLAADESILLAPLRAVPPKPTQRLWFRASGDETLEDIAGFFQVSVAELAAWNRLAPAVRLQAGLMLQLFVAEDRAWQEQASIYVPSRAHVLETPP